MEGLIFGGAYIRKEICVSKSIELAWLEIYVSNFQNVFTEAPLEDGDLAKTHPCKYFVWSWRKATRCEEQPQEGKTSVILNQNYD